MEKRITNPDGRAFVVTRKTDPRYGEEPILVFKLPSGQGTGASYFLSSIMGADPWSSNKGPEDTILHGAVPEWWVSRENILEAVNYLFSPAELDRWVK